MREGRERGEQPLSERTLRDIANTTEDQEVIDLLTPYMDGALSTQSEEALEELVQKCDALIAYGTHMRSIAPENIVDRTGKTNADLRASMNKKSIVFTQYLPEVRRRAAEALDFKRNLPNMLDKAA